MIVDMNDFTKDELKVIIDCIQCISNIIWIDDWYKQDSLIPLESKLQFMIDTYCEDAISFYHCNHCKESLAMDLQCPACGLGVKDE